MRTKTALIAAIFLGLFTYAIPLFAGNNEYHTEEQTVIEIPVVGKITTKTSSHFSGCKLMERTTYKMHNSLIKAMSESGGKHRSTELSDMCEEIQWQYVSDEQTYRSYTFEELRDQHADDDENDAVQIDMGIDHNDINEPPRITREIMGVEKNINGLKARKVVTYVHFDEAENPLIIEEYYSKDVKALEKINSAREDLKIKMNQVKNIDGVPEFVQLIYGELQSDQEWARPEGEVVRFSIRMLDEDDDPVFTMNYDVVVAEVIDFNEDHFALK